MMGLPCEVFKCIFPSQSYSTAVVLIFSVILAKAAACQHGQISPDPSSCSNYLQCNHGQNLVRPCPQNLHFNPSTSTCDWPSNVNCGGDSNNGESGGDSTGSSVSSTSVPSPEPEPDTEEPESSSSTMPALAVTAASSVVPAVPSQTPSPAPEIPALHTSHIHFAPYFDVNMDGPSLPQLYAKTGQKFFTLAFALGSAEGCKPKWGGVNEINDPAIINPVRQVQAAGGQFIVATGGAMGPYFETLCSNVDELANAYKTVLDAVGTNHVDVDIEATVDTDRMNKALAKVQRERPNTTVSFTLMVQAEDYGLTPSLGVDILRNAKSNGVRVTIVNPMTMEFGGPSADFGDSVIGAAKSVLQQMKQIWPEKSPRELNKMLGVTPMLGKNYNGKIFTQEHARKLVKWANENHIGLLAFWSVGRDNGKCAGGGISPSCSSIAQSEYEFTKIFQDFRG